ncbi:hypothetical protein HWV62_39169 [Athelia sp. TMB]|nr:hypothetical protein HWV62_39169 [Athelia sp. TMB]
MATSQPNTPRRSTRRTTTGPLVARSARRREDTEVYTWVGQPTHSRPSVRDDFMDEEEWIEANGDSDSDDEKEEWDRDEKILVTRFYEAFTVSGRKARPGMARFTNVKAKVKGKAREQEERYSVGDTVLVYSTNRLPSVGVIISMWENRWTREEEEEVDSKVVKIHWFLRPSELAGVRAKRDHQPGEIYYSLSQTVTVAPLDILTKCSVSNESNDEEGENYFCRAAVDSGRGLYYAFDWEDHRRAALDSEGGGMADVWDVLVKEEVKAKNKGKSKASKKDVEAKKKTVKQVLSDEEDGIEESEGSGLEDDYEHASGSSSSAASDVPESDLERESDEDELDSDTDTLRTPSRKRKRAATRTPSKPKASRQLAQPTPHSRKSLAARKKKKPLRIPRPVFDASLANARLPKDPWLRAQHFLHVGSRPDVLVGREEEYKRCLSAVEELVDEGSGGNSSADGLGITDISGVPGTGKTATVHAIETNPFTYVEINGLKLPEPSAAYSLLWEGVSGHDVAADGHLSISAKESLRCLSKHFSSAGRGRGGPGGHACVVLMDELDQLVTAKQDVVYNFFNWPTLLGSKLIVLAVANTMDLPERVMSGRVRSRLGMIRINFQPYTTPQLERIVQARLQSAKDGLDGEGQPNVIAPDGIKFAAMKVSSISGDARRVLDICRRAVEQVQPHKRVATTNDVKEVIKLMQNSPTAAYLRDCSLHERIMLAALIRVIKQQGVDEVRWGDVQYQHLMYMNNLPNDDDPKRKPSAADLDMVLESLAASRAMLIEEGVTASRKAEGDRKVILNLEQGEVERVLSDVGGMKWKNALNA